MNSIVDLVQVFDSYRKNPTTVGGHKILQMIKSGEVEEVLHSAQSQLDEVEYNKVFINPDPRMQEIADKYKQIMDIVMSDCQPRG